MIALQPEYVRARVIESEAKVEGVCVNLSRAFGRDTLRPQLCDFCTLCEGQVIASFSTIPRIDSQVFGQNDGSSC